MSSLINIGKKTLPFIVILIVFLVLSSIMKASKPEIEKVEEPMQEIKVTTSTVSLQSIIPKINADGILKPKSMITINSEVSGKVTFVADALMNNDVFKKGDLIIKIDSIDYELAITKAKANVSSQLANLELQKAKSELAKEDWEKYGKKGKPSSLNLNLPQVKSAEAALASAKADLQLAQRNLEKTNILAPFDGVVLNRNVNPGQYVMMGGRLAEIAASNIGEIRIALEDSQLNFDVAKKPKVMISASGDDELKWTGHIANVESQRDERTLLNFAVVNIENPLFQQPTPLRFNSFVNVKIELDEVKDVYPIERGLLLSENKVKVLDKGSKLEYRKVMVKHSDENHFYVNADFLAGDELITSQVSNLATGTRLSKSN